MMESDSPQTPLPGVLSTQLCIPNINTSERRRRLAAGVVEVAIALVILAVLLAFGVSRWWRLALLPVFWGAALGFFQWRDRT
jgi:hypothetical protein